MKLFIIFICKIRQLLYLYIFLIYQLVGSIIIFENKNKEVTQNDISAHIENNRTALQMVSDVTEAM